MPPIEYERLKRTKLEEAINLLKQIQKNCTCNDRFYACNICKAIATVIQEAEKNVRR